MRKYKVIQGVSYPNLFVEENQPNRVAAALDDNGDRGHYYDPAIRLSKKDVAGFIGKPICLEHNEGHEIGKITHAWADAENHMRITARIYTDTPEGEALYNRINGGNLRGLSVGYSAISHADDPNTIVGKHFSEVSVCQEPFFAGADIRVAASKKTDYKSKSTSVIYLKIMASEVKNTASEEAAPLLEKKNADASEMARIHDELLRKSEEAEAELQRLREERTADKARLEELERDKQAQRERYAESQKPNLDYALDVAREQYKETHGAEAELPKDYIDTTTTAFSMPEAAHVSASIMASARAYRNMQEKSKSTADRLAEMEEKLKKLSEEQSMAMAHVNASQRRIQTPKKDEEEFIPVTASSSNNLDIKNLFVPQPSEQEQLLYAQNYGVKVTASAQRKQLPPLPQAGTQNLRNSTPNSMSRHDAGKYLFHHLVANSAGFSKLGSVDLKTEVNASDN